MLLLSAIEVSGPLATTQVSAGTCNCSLRITRIRGCASIFLVTIRAKDSLSTARAPPAGTAVASAQLINSDPNNRSSSLRRPEARSAILEPREFEQTNSESHEPEWAPVCFDGRISYSITSNPLSAACQAASLPAYGSPPREDPDPSPHSPALPPLSARQLRRSG